MATILTRRVTRDKLALFLKAPDGRPNHELIKAFENLFYDVGETIPGEIGEGADQIDAEALNGGAARVEAGAALALALAVGRLADVLASAPAQTPQVIPQALCDCTQVLALREEIAVLRAQIQALQIAPN